MHEKGLKSAIFWRRWVIYNLPLLFKQIIRQRTASSTYVFNQNAQKPWTCVFIGYAIGESIKNNSDSIGTREHLCEQIIGQNIIPPPIIVTCEVRFSHHTK